MGKKVNPIGFRLGHGINWSSAWFARRGSAYRKNLLEDLKMREYLMERLALAGIVTVEIRRSINKINVILHVSRPGVVIGRGGSSLEILKKELEKMVSVPEPSKNLQIDVVEVKNAELAAQLVATKICEQLKRRFPHRRVVAKAMERVMAAGAQGVKITLSGRIAGAEISRREKYSQGKVPLHTIRAKIDYVQIPALTKFGYIGVKVWIYTGE
ncbi:30S ribosomal protein S3 [Patescibacteria group bacterium]|nr:30S ribosomal protein S3 [Patescibacteria group bacterium]